MSSSPSAASFGAASFDFEQLAAPPRRERPPTMDEAHRRAEAIIAQAHSEANAIRDQARREGFAEGLVAGRAELRQIGEPAVQALATAVEAVRAFEAQAADSVEEQAVTLAVEIAEKVVAGAIAAGPGRVLDGVRGALRAVVDRERLVIQVNPEDLEIVREGLDELRGSLGGIGHIDVQEERRVQRGGALIRTSVGEIDANIRAKLDRAREAVVKELRA